MAKGILKFVDGLVNVLSELVNRRSATGANIVDHQKLDPASLRAIYKSGLGSKIVRIKAGYSLKDTLQFQNDRDKNYYRDNLRVDVLKAARYMIGFGRGIIVMYQNGDDLSKPFVPDANRRIRQRVFSGDIIQVTSFERDFESERYYKPTAYNVRGVQFHWSRVVDFSYFEPVEQDAPQYQYGGISEFELIYPQMVNDGVVERASGAIVEKNATIFYGVEGFRDALEQGKDKDIVKYFGMLEDARSIYGAGIVDKADTVTSVGQTLTNLAEVDNITLRRLAMVTGIPLAWLIGENVKGLNSTGDNERQIFQDMLEGVQDDYLLQPINRLLKVHGLAVAKFKENQGDTPRNRMGYEKDAIANAKVLYDMGEDHKKYLEERDIFQQDDFDKFFSPTDDAEDVDELAVDQPAPATTPANSSTPPPVDPVDNFVTGKPKATMQ